MLEKSIPSRGKNLDAIPESGLLGKVKDPQEASVVRMEREDSARIAWAVDARPWVQLPLCICAGPHCPEVLLLR